MMPVRLWLQQVLSCNSAGAVIVRTEQLKSISFRMNPEGDFFLYDALALLSNMCYYFHCDTFWRLRIERMKGRWHFDVFEEYFVFVYDFHCSSVFVCMQRKE